MRKLTFLFSAVVALSMLLAACGPTATTVAPATKAPEATEVPATEAPMVDEATATAEVPPTPVPPTPYVVAGCPDGMTCVRWFVGMGTGTNAVQIPVEEAVVADFNAEPARATDKIHLILEVVPFDSARDTILTEIAAGNGPDIVGPVGWSGSNSLNGQFADLSAEIAAIPEITSTFDPALIKSYITDSEGQIGLPFAVYPSALFINTALFDEAGLAYPPAKYGEKYKWNGADVEWNWDTLKTVAQTLTVDANGKNATEDGFDKSKIVQYGFSFNFETQPSYVGTFMSNGGTYVGKDGKAQLPENWKKAWEYLYDGVWGAKPFIPNASVAASPDFGNGNVFSSGKVAMIDQPAWYTCCTGDLKTFDFAAMPVSLDGKVAGRIDADTFRILKSTKNKAAAFTVLTYLVTTGVQKLIIGSDATPAAYGAVPARAQDGAAWIAAKKVAFPWVKNWDTLLAGLSYPDSPSAESYMPNYNEAWTRGQTFYNLLVSTGGLDVQQEEATFLTDLQAIFDKK